MEKKYTVSQIEAQGVESEGVFYGVHRQGWIIGADFVDYAGLAQLVMPVFDGISVHHIQWSKNIIQSDGQGVPA